LVALYASGIVLGINIMTNYGDWERFNVEAELSRTESRLEVEEYAALSMRDEEASSKALADTQSNAARLAAALKSKNAVEALRAKCAPGGNRRKAQAASDSQTGETTTSTSAEEAGDSLMSNLASTIDSLSSTLTSLADQSEEVARLAESPKEGDEALGVSKATQFLERAQDFKSSRLSAARALQHIAASAGDADKTSSGLAASEAIVSSVEASLNILEMRVLANFALCALSAENYALAADVARRRLKLESPPSKASKSRDRHSEARVWMTRTLAFCGMGCVHLAHTHLKQVRTLSPNFPNIDCLLAFMETKERAYARLFGAREAGAVKASVENQARRLVSRLQSPAQRLGLGSKRRLGCGRSREVTESLLADLLESAGTAGAAGAETAGGDAESSSSAHLDEEDEEEGQGEEEEEEIKNRRREEEAEGGVTVAQLAAQFPLSFQDSDSANTALAQLRLCFYEAQILYLEGMFLSAEIKYYAVILGLLVFRGALGLRVWDGRKRAESHVRALLSVSLVNAASCRVQRNHLARACGDAVASRAVRASDPYSEGVTFASSCSVASLLCMSARQLCDEGLRVKDSPALRTRYLALFEGSDFVSASFSIPSKEREPLSQAEAPEEDEGEADPWGVIASYGTAPPFSQLFLLGSPTALPLMHAGRERGE